MDLGYHLVVHEAEYVEWSGASQFSKTYGRTVERRLEGEQGNVAELEGRDESSK